MPGHIFSNSQILVMPSGALVAVAYYADSQPGAIAGKFIGNSAIVVFRSTDKGRKWSAAKAVGTIPGFPGSYSAANSGGHIAIAWQGGTEPVKLAQSYDGGQTWGVRTAVPAGHGAFAPTVALGKDGSLGLTYYDHRNQHAGASTNLTDTWFRSSRDSVQWSETHLGVTFDMNKAPTTNGAGGQPLGDYFGLVAVPGGFAAAFTQGKPAATHGPTDIFYARMLTP
jgi:hypothetical protein